MSTDERVFESRLESLGRDGRSCAGFVYTALALQHLGALDHAARHGMAGHEAFWSGVLGALHVAGIAALDRLYDEDRNAGSMARALRFAERHKAIFSAARIEARTRAIGIPVDAAKQCAATAYEPQPRTFAPLFRSLDEMRRLYAAVLQPLRKQVVADLGRLAPARRAKLFGGDHVREIEQLAVFPLRLHRALFKLYHDGHEPLLEVATTPIADVLAASPSAYQELWEHERAARSAEAFFASLSAGREPLRFDLPGEHPWGPLGERPSEVNAAE